LSLKPLQADAEGAAPHLLDHIEHVTINLRGTIREAFAKDLDTILKRIFWPKPSIALPQSIQEDFDTAVIRLLTLQETDLEVSQHQENEVPPPPPVLLPFEVIVAPLEARFRYHFATDRPTNRLDKPEYFLSHVLDLLSSHDDFVNESIQPLLLIHFRGTPMSLNPIYIDATSAYITALLPMLRQKVLSIMPQVSSQPQLLSHLVHELMSFDNTLRTEWHYTGSTTHPSSVWKGMTWEILMHHDYFTRWLTVEKDFALSRYTAIIDNPSTSVLDYDSTPYGTTKPTKAAIQVHDLLDTITSRYRNLFSFTNKLRFLIEIQISIFDRFHSRLHSGLEAYLSITTGLGRAVSSASSADVAAVQGTNGLDRLCRIFGSADYLERKMRDWSDDVFFLDLWAELQYRARNNKGHARLNVAEVAARTSQTLSSGADDEDTGALFDETAAAYARLRTRTESTIVDTLIRNAREALRPYSRSISSWSQASSNSSSNANTTPSVDLSSVLSYLNDSLSFLSSALGPLPLRRISKHVLKMLDTYILDRIILSNRFSVSGAAQMRTDVLSCVDAFERLEGLARVGERGLSKCADAVRLLVVEDGGRGSDGGAQDHDAWDIGEEEEKKGGDEMEVDGGSVLTLWSVERRLFESNESARDLLEEMGLEGLSESEARQVLQRRVELVI